MTPERYQQIGDLFHAALEVSPEQRAAFLAQACAGDEELLREVESLIASDNEAGSFIHAPALEVVAEALAHQPGSSDARFLGPYKILELIGRGGMGEVHLAQDSRLGRRVAIKLLPNHFVRNEERLRRFRHEARAASALNHPNIITIHEVGEAGATHYIVTELIEGETLRASMKGNRLELDRALDIAVQTASALVAAHAAGIVHRDIKPENIMLRSDGYVKVLDFGIAKLMEDSVGATRSGDTFETSPGLAIGTAYYMSPEQAQGLKIDERTDVWSLGIVLFEMLTGKLPFKEKTRSHTIVAILERELAPLEQYGSAVPVELERVIIKALSKNPDQRHQSMKELLVDLKDLQRGLDSEARVKTTTEVVHSTVSVPGFFKSMRLYWLAGALAFVALLAAVVGVVYFNRASKPAINSLAVLPFVNATADPNTEHLSEGITESLINSLSQVPKLRVMARSTVFTYKGTQQDSQKAGGELGVDAVVTGKVTQVADTLIIQVELVDVATGAQLWGERFNRKLTDVVTVQEEMSREIAVRLHLQMTEEERQRVSKQHTVNPDAYQSYLKGRYHWNKRTPDGIRKSIEYFNEALAIDPLYAQAYAGIADAYIVHARYNFGHPRESYPKARAAATKALEIDDTLAEAHSSLAVVKMDYEWDVSGAEQEFKRAVSLNPNYPVAHQWYGLLLAAQGRADEGLAETKRAQQLDPLSLIVDMGVGGLYIYARRHDEAIAHLQKTRELHPEAFQPDSNLAYVYEIKGMRDEAVASYLRSRTLSGDTPERVAALATVYKTSGWRGFVQKRIDEMMGHSKAGRYVSPFSVALLYAQIDEKSKALVWLEKTYEERNYRLLFIKIDARLDSLRSEPKFIELVKRVEQTVQ